MCQFDKVLIILCASAFLAHAVSQQSSPSDEDVITQLRAAMAKQQEDLKKQQEEFRTLVNEVKENRHSIQELKTQLEKERAEKERCGCTEYGEETENTAKRADDVDPLTVVVSQVSQRVDDVTAEIETLKTRDQSLGTAVDAATGSVYVRWGKSSCSDLEHLVYSGIIGGSNYRTSSGATNPLCLPVEPAYLASSQGSGMVQLYAGLFGAEYETQPETSHNLDAVCAVCRPAKATTLMIPATTSCHPGWTLEYFGYIMADRTEGDRAGTEFICVDSEMEGRAGSRANDDGLLLYYTQSHCGSLPCPPYEEGRVVSCVVCSK